MHPILNMSKKVLGFAAITILYLFLIMIIWNRVIVKKFPNSNIQQLSYWDSLLLSVLFSLVSTGIFSSFYQDDMYCSQTDDYDE